MILISLKKLLNSIRVKDTRDTNWRSRSLFRERLRSFRVVDTNWRSRDSELVLGIGFLQLGHVGSDLAEVTKRLRRRNRTCLDTNFAKCMFAMCGLSIV
jgi:hypothetical protein